MGKSGIVAKNLLKKLNKLNLKNIAIGRSKLNLKQKNSDKKLKKIIKNGDIVVFVAAEAPVKNIEMFFNDTGSPVLIKDPSDFNSIFVVMPMKG